jgi:Glycosyl transferase family 2/Domain of unknown function (DUF4037)
MTTSEFVHGLDLSELFYHQVVRPILDTEYPEISHSAALLGWGSDVLGYDDQQSTDHMWGLRLYLFVSQTDFQHRHDISQMLCQKLPYEFLGYATHFQPNLDDRFLAMTEIDRGLVQHLIYVESVESYFQRYLGYCIHQPLAIEDWLTFSEHKLLMATSGKVFHDGLGTLQATRQKLAYYPHDVWLYLLACQWKILGEEELFVGRSGYVGDDLGSALIAAQQVRHLMRLCFLMERQYAPYGKWFGTAFSHLNCAHTLRPIFQSVLQAESWKNREALLCEAYQVIAGLHNALGLTEPLSEQPVQHKRAYWIIDGKRFSQAIWQKIQANSLKQSEFRGGSINQLLASSNDAASTELSEKLKSLYRQEERTPNPPLVSIIIPCYNAAPRLAACLQSCLQQTYPNLEIIFVDNSSTDASATIARQIVETACHPIHLLHCPEKGANYARNLGFTHAQGEYIQWLDADDELDPDKIALQVVALERDRTYDVACADWEWHYYQQDKLHFRMGFSAQCFEDAMLQFLLHHWHPPHAYLLRRAAAQRLHQEQAWYPGRPIGMDREYFTVAGILGLRFLAVPGAMVRYYTWSASQLTRSVSYLQRVEAMQQVFARFQKQVYQSRSPAQVTGLHWFLLRQNWDLWQLAPGQIRQMGEGCFWVECTGQPIGMSLNPGEARIVAALSQLGGVQTLDDYAHQVLRFLWKQVVVQPGVKAESVATALAQWVGLLPDEHPVSLVVKAQPSPEQQAMLNRINTIPLYAPMFPEVRLAVLQCLDKLRGVGMLQPVKLPSGEQQTQVA